MPAPDPDLAATQAALKALVDRWTRLQPRFSTPIAGLSLYREEEPGPPHSYVRDTALCLIVQGRKHVTLGSEVLKYDDQHFLLASIDVPVVAVIPEATPETPYLSLVFRLDPREVSELVIRRDLPPALPLKEPRSLLVSAHTPELLGAVLRLVSLLDEPESLPILAPLVQREILFRLLTGPWGPHLRAAVAAGSPGTQIGRAVEWLRANFRQSFRVEDLAAVSQMSSTAFHHHFRRLTAMSPLQFQKWLRLQEARRLMLAENFDAARAAYQVGYESPSQFSREYRRLFEAPPSQDIKSLRGAPVATSG